MQAIPRLVISATRGGLGKTTLAIGITAAWRKQGRRVAVFKKGPDFIDAGWLGAAAGTACYNLDLFMMAKEQILRSFVTHSANSDVAVIEGNRGLFDGMDETGTYSTARLAKLLKAPVIIIVDCTKASNTVGAVVLGCRNYDPEADIQGVILNNVSSGRHETVIRKSIERSSGLQVVGAVPRRKKGEFPERHMGLTPFHEHPQVEQAISAAAAVAEQYLDIDALWSIASGISDLDIPASLEPVVHQEKYDEQPVIGVIRDTAFQFYYPDNLEALERHGARIEIINALRDETLPAIDALYIGGGFPETQAAELAANESFCRSIKAGVEQGLPVYAECGGLIYLGRSLKTQDREYAMTGVLPVDFVLENKPQAHGYTVLKVGNNGIFLGESVIIKGHEFHYSRVEGGTPLPLAYEVTRGGGIDGKGDGFVYKNVIGCYTHLHALGTPEWAEAMVRKAYEYRNQKIRSGKQVLS